MNWPYAGRLERYRDNRIALVGNSTWFSGKAVTHFINASLYTVI